MTQEERDLITDMYENMLELGSDGDFQGAYNHVRNEIKNLCKKDSDLAHAISGIEIEFDF